MPRPGDLFSRHRPDDELVETKIATFDQFWQCQTLDTGDPMCQSKRHGSPSARNAEFVVTQAHLFLALLGQRRNLGSLCENHATRPKISALIHNGFFGA
jgi:hypothetical protein